jgi:hypothetical protein
MIISRFASALNTVPLLNPVDTAATALATPFVKLGGSHGGTLFVHFGNIAAASADQAVTVTLEAATAAASGSEAAVAFNYRLSGAVGANTFGAITAAASTGVSIGTTDDGKMLAIDIDPSKFLAAKADTTYVRAVITPDAGGTATLVSAFAQLEPRVSQSTMISAT